MRECVMITTTVNSGGTFAMMNEGQALIMMILLFIIFTLSLNGIIQGIIG
mgnify:CR=1 FL=1